MTKYIVLKQGMGSGEWLQSEGRNSIEASSAEDAIRTALGNDVGGTFVAIPARSFNPVTVTVETKPIVRIGKATPAPPE